MTDKQTQSMAPQGNMEKDPADWVTGDEPMTGAQRSYLRTLSEEAKQPFDETLSKADASRRIDELQAVTGRGTHGHAAGQDGRQQAQGAQPQAQSAQEQVGADADLEAGRATAAVETVVSR
jgi:hypothetical protein